MCSSMSSIIYFYLTLGLSAKFPFINPSWEIIFFISDPHFEHLKSTWSKYEFKSFSSTILHFVHL